MFARAVEDAYWLVTNKYSIWSKRGRLGWVWLSMAHSVCRVWVGECDFSLA